MKIVYITSNYLPHLGGLENYVYSLANYFSQKNTVVVITADYVLHQSRTEMEDNIKVVRLPAFIFSGFVLLKKKYRMTVCEEINNADVVHLNDCKFLYAFLARRKKEFNYRLILSSHGFFFHTRKHSFLKQMYFKTVIKWYSKFYESIICVSEQDYDIGRHFGLDDMTVIYPGVDIYKFCDLPVSRNEKTHFVYFGRIATNKGLYECLKKLSSLNNFKFDIIGLCKDDAYMKKLEDVIMLNKLQNSVNFVGRKTDAEVKDYLSACDYILFPSLYEGFGMTLTECLLSGKKILANTNTSFTKILKTVSAEQYLFDFESATTDLLSKLKELKFVNIAPELVEQFSVEAMLTKIGKVYCMETYK